MLPGIPSGVPSFDTPLGVKCLIGTCCLVYLLEFFMPALASSYALAPVMVASNFGGNWVTMLTYAFLHQPVTSATGLMGVMHLLMNMACLFAMGSELEEKMGTTAFLGMSLTFAFWIGATAVPLAFFFEGLAGDALNYTHIRAIGFSGILFAYFMMYLKVTPDETVTLCGKTIYKWTIPFANLILLTIILHTSFVTHMAGIVVGCIYIAGFPGVFDLRHRLLQVFENLPVFDNITARDDFQQLPQVAIIHEWDNPCANVTRSLETIPLGESIIPKRPAFDEIP